MKHVVIESGLHDSDIRPPSLLTEFRRLSIEGARKFFSDPSTLVEVPCPACDSPDSTEVFKKEGFTYRQCKDCESAFVSPRPNVAALADYYEDSEATQYRVEHFQRETAEARRNHLIRSLTNWMGRIIDEKGNPSARSFADFGTNSPLIFDEIDRLGLFDTKFSIDPLPGLDQELDPFDVTVADESLANLGAMTALQQLEHQFSPFNLLKTAADRLAESGLFFFTTRTISGFDLQMLWDKTPYIFVPEHLNLLSIQGIAILLERAGLETIELSTPGQLDLELTMHAAEADPEIKLPGFVQTLIDQRDELAHADFQSFLQKHRLSSHVRVAASRSKGA